jgi:exopolysaccharide biosynthesis polyprenyl glycosylphosphotransferase
MCRSGCIRHCKGGFLSVINLKRQIALKVFQISDLLLMLFSLLAASYPAHFQYQTISFAQLLSMRVKLSNFAILLLLLFAWRVLFDFFGLYRSRRFSQRRKEFTDVVKATTIGTFILLFAAILFHISLATPLFLASFWCVSSSMIVLSRIILRSIVQKARLRGHNLRHMLIVGTNSRAIRFAGKVEARPDLGYRIVGFVENGWTGNAEFHKMDYRTVVDFKGLPEYIRKNVVDEVVVCLPMKSLYQKCAEIVALCQEQGIIVRFMSDFFDLKSGSSKADHLEGDALLTIHTGAMHGWQVVAKRTIDFTLSLITLLCLLPLLLIVSILIKFSSPGPIFFVQERVGLNKRRFRLYKFRTMVPDAEKKLAELEQFNEASGPVFKIKNDPRITWIGKYLRKFSIDELPQLLNVMRGNMSLVGPRPLPVRDYEGFDQDWQRRRFSVRPGITCLWQISGRSNIAFDKWMNYDMDYIDNWSLILDLRILIKTIPVVLRGVGAQ